MISLEQFFYFLLHIDTYLIAFVTTYGIWTYALLFAIIFCETGFFVFPFLPGDSLLFAAGTLAAHPSQAIEIKILLLLLIIASIAGNKMNYLIGRFIGPRLFFSSRSWLFNKKHLEETKHFYRTHGGKTIIFARFIPILRSFAPFVAGIGHMSPRLFFFYNVISAVLWIASLLYAGYFFGNLPFIQQNFSLVIYLIIIVSLLPTFIGISVRYLSTRGKKSSNLH